MSADSWRDHMSRPRRQLVCLCALAALACVPALAAARPLDYSARPGALDRVDHPARAARLPRITRAGWISGFTVTEYYPVPEAWFVGARVRAPGLSGTHRIDWLYSARGVTMEGDGVGLDGRRYHVDNTGIGGWVDRLGRSSSIGGSRGVFWRAGGFYRNRAGAIAATHLLPQHRGRPQLHPPGQPDLHPLLPQHLGRLVRRPGHRRGDQREARRRLPPAAALVR